MASGPFHYAEAERLLGVATEADQAATANAGKTELAYRAAAKRARSAAKVHALLAQVAATIEAADHAKKSDHERLVVRPLAGDDVDPPYPGNPWGRALHGTPS